MTTVASVSNSVILPAAVAGMVVRVANAAAANQMNVYPKIGEKMLGVSNAAFAVPAGKSAIFFCVVAGNGIRPLSPDDNFRIDGARRRKPNGGHSFAFAVE